MATPAVTKRLAAKKKGGSADRPILMAIQVRPQIAHIRTNSSRLRSVPAAAAPLMEKANPSSG